MDRGAIKKILNTIVQYGSYPNYILVGQLTKVYEGLGYRKLPKDKPPLIRVPKADEFIEEDAKTYVEGLRDGAQAQWEADIKWYEADS